MQTEAKLEKINYPMNEGELYQYQFQIEDEYEVGEVGSEDKRKLEIYGFFYSNVNLDDPNDLDEIAIILKKEIMKIAEI